MEETIRDDRAKISAISVKYFAILIAYPAIQFPDAEKINLPLRKCDPISCGVEK